MTMRQMMVTFRDWAALAGAFAMVAFLTFVPQHGPASSLSRGTDRARAADISWPSQSGKLAALDDATR